MLRTLKQVLARSEIGRQWDLLVIGDGSGGSWKGGCGWAGAVLDRRLGIWHAIVGGQNYGTVTIGEIFAFWMPLRYHLYNVLRKEHVPYSAHILSDNSAVVGCGNKDCHIKANKDLWAAIDLMAAHYYKLRFHLVPGCGDAMHELMDQLSVSAREYMENCQDEQLPAISQILSPS